MGRLIDCVSGVFSFSFTDLKDYCKKNWKIIVKKTKQNKNYKQ